MKPVMSSHKIFPNGGLWLVLALNLAVEAGDSCPETQRLYDIAPNESLDSNPAASR